MKSIFAFFLISISLAANAQFNRLDIGVQGGVSRASLYGNSSIYGGHKARMGYAGGLFAQYNFTPHIALRSGVSFERKGSTLELTMMDITGAEIGTFRGKETFDYLTVPLLFRFSFGKKIQYFVNAGPYVGFLLKQTEYIEAFQILPETTNDLTANFKKNEFGASLGAGVNYALNDSYVFSVEVRNNLGLNNLSALPLINMGTIKTNALGLLVGLHYRLGRQD
ncbi:MAG: PorT family protein [Bacteroidetes bacterium]|nr:PorT family protein [Bacteroidota bacterium]